MGKLLTQGQRQELKEAHRCESKRQYADRIKAVLLLDVGWSADKIAEALLLDERSIWNYKKLYEEGGVETLCIDHRMGRQCQLTDQQLEELTEHLRFRLYSTALEVSAYVGKTYDVYYSISGMRDLLHGIGFNYTQSAMNLQYGGNAQLFISTQRGAETRSSQREDKWKMSILIELYYHIPPRPLYLCAALR